MSSDTHVIFDIETLGMNPFESVVLDFSAATFQLREDQPETMDEILSDNTRFFQSKLDVESQLKQGRTIDQATMSWWSKQDKKVLANIAPKDTDVTVEEFLVDFQDWLNTIEGYNPRKTLFFCRGASFDFPFLDSLIKTTPGFKKPSDHWPVAFWNQRDIRTVLATLYGDMNSANGILTKRDAEKFEKHNSLHDIAKDIISMQALWAVNAGVDVDIDLYIKV